MANEPQQHGAKERAQPWLIGGGLLIAYWALMQANLTYDGAAFIAWYHDSPKIHYFHPLWPYFFNLFLKGGHAAGLSFVEAGQLQAALTAAAAGALYFVWLRRLAVGFATATLFAMLFGLSGTVIEIGTTVELYGVSLLAVILCLHAWLSEMRKPSAMGAVAFWVACFAVTALHVAWALLVLALYLSLAWEERARVGRVIGRLGEGALVAAAVGGWLILGGALGQRSISGGEHFFESFFQVSGGAMGLIVRPFLNIFDGFIENGGMLLCASIPGAFYLRKREPEMFQLWAIATVLFFVCFGYWTPDRGEFLLAIAPVWGFFCARAAEEWAADESIRHEVMMFVLFYGAVILGAIWFKPNYLFAAVFWVYAIASGVRGARARTEEKKSHSGECRSREGEWKSRAGVYGLLLGLTLATYVPVAAGQLKPDADTVRLKVFMEIAPKDARLVTAIWPYWPYAQTLRQTISPLAEGAPGTEDAHRMLEAWVGDLRAGGPTIWFDQVTWDSRKNIFGEIKWEDLPQRRIMTRGVVFYELLPPQ